MQRFTSVAMPARGDGNEPGRSRTKKSGCTHHKSQNHGGLARSRNILFCLGNDLIDATLRFGWRQARKARDQSNKISAIVRLKAAMTGGGQENARGLGAGITDISLQTSWAAIIPEQPSPFIPSWNSVRSSAVAKGERMRAAT
jgi:hypothetical protein